MRRLFIDWCVDLSPGELSGNGFPVVGDLRERDVLVAHLMQHQTCVQTARQQLGRQQRIPGTSAARDRCWMWVSMVW